MTRTEIAQEGARGLPLYAYIAAHFKGVTIHEVVAYLTAVYVVLQIIYLVRKIIGRDK